MMNILQYVFQYVRTVVTELLGNCKMFGNWDIYTAYIVIAFIGVSFWTFGKLANK